MGRSTTILFLSLLLATSLAPAAFADEPATGPTASMPAVNSSSLTDVDTAVEFTLLKDEVDTTGKWVQAFRIVIKLGGTVAEASELVYGTSAHVDELFAAIREQHPELRSPAAVPANLTADITLDPRIAFVPRSVATDGANGATITAYHNGVRRITYDPKLAKDHKGLSEIVDLPGDRPAKTFSLLENATLVEVPAGVRLAYYEFQPDDNLKAVVAEIYDNPSTRAIGDFLSQTRWDPNHWPPAPLERQQRLVVPLGTSFDDDAFSPLDLGSATRDPQVAQQVAARAEAGIFAVRRQPYSTVYHIVANDFNLTARQASKLLYGDENGYLTVAASAGLGSLYELQRDPPTDVRLFGAVFDIIVEYEQERFTGLQSADVRPGGKSTTVLLNGTTIYDYSVPRGKSGVLREVLLPSGYRKVVFRPQGLTMTGGQVLYALASLGRVTNPHVDAEEEGNFVGQIMWNWGRSVEHRPGEILDYSRVIEIPGSETEGADQLVEFSIRPSSAEPEPSLPFYRDWLISPLFLGVAGVFVAVFALGTLTWVIRHV